MARESKTNRFTSAGEALVNSNKEQEKNVGFEETATVHKKDKVISAKVLPETWATFTAINKAQGMTNNSVINMLISDYVLSKQDILK